MSDDSFTYSDSDMITRSVLENLIGKLTGVNCENIKREGVFSEERIVYNSQDEVIEKTLKEIRDQEQIALRALELFGGPESSHINSYFWEVGFENFSFLSKKNYLVINLVLKTGDEKAGRILFPITIVKCLNQRFNYWEVINFDDAINSLGSLV